MQQEISNEDWKEICSEAHIVSSAQVWSRDVRDWSTTRLNVATLTSWHQIYLLFKLFISISLMHNASYLLPLKYYAAARH